MKRTTLFVLFAAAAAAVAIVYPRVSADAPAPARTAITASEPALIAAAGRTEPASEEVRVGSELDGKLASVPVEEGQHVKRGQVLAVLVNADYRARVEAARAGLAERKAELLRLVNGARTEERREAQAAIREAEAVLDNTRAELRRRRVLLDRGAISRTEFGAFEREFRVAEARLDAARQHHAVVDAEARRDEKMRLEAEVAGARALLAEAEARLAKTVIRSPLDGVVLRKSLKTGESVPGDGSASIVTLGDTSRMRVRADVDEADVARLQAGQRAYVTAAAYGDRRFPGRVVRIGQILGRKNVRTDEPSERVDRKILETLVELDAGVELPVGLRVDTFIETSGKS